MIHRFLKIACVAAMVGLTACANVRGVTSDVSSFSSWPAGRPAGTYVFERLPSQNQQASQDELEQAARGALTEAGFTEGKPDTAQFNVQLGARVGEYGGGCPGSNVGVFGGFGSGGRSSFGGVGLGLSFGGGGSSYSDREVSVLVRDRKTGQTLYESRAHNDGNGGGDSRVYEAMFSAALKDFPNPAVNPRRVVIDTP